MIISYNWLLQYLPLPLPVYELSHLLTSIGLEVESVVQTGFDPSVLEGLLVGEVITCSQHPNADKLKITTVSTGAQELLQIVCGAPNVAAGQKVIVAPVGAVLKPATGAAVKIKKSKIRGEVSEGMLCAGDEAGISTDHSGIYILPDIAVPGKDIADFIPAAQLDYTLHIGLTPNRYDAASHIGVARDVVAYLKHKTPDAALEVRYPTALIHTGSAAQSVSIRIDATIACPRYMGLLMENITVAPSPEWLQERLSAIGLRSINNVVDVTNFVLHEYGHPLHAFDADKIQGNRIEVKFLQEGSKLKTLDGEVRTLRSTDLMICDAAGPLAIAGVFGGAESGVQQSTKRIFLESACFDPTHIRRTALYHGLRTEAAVHFEKGTDIEALPTALFRAAELLMELCGATIPGAVQDVWPQQKLPVSVSTTYNFITQLSGKQYAKQTTDNILEALGFRLEAATDKGFTAIVPSWKTDITQPADLVEEIIRIDGLDNIAPSEKLSMPLLPSKPNDRALRNKISNYLSGAGFSEILTNSITNSRQQPAGSGVPLLNSLSNELDALRANLTNGALEVIAWNINRKSQDLLLYEYGSVYAVLETGSFVQNQQMLLSATGLAVLAGWQSLPKKADVYFLKAMLEQVFRQSGIPVFSEAATGDEVHFYTGKALLATIRQATAAELNLWKIKQPVAFAVINQAALYAASQEVSIRFSDIPRFPTVVRDLALVLDRTVGFDAVRIATAQANADFLQDYRVFDVFESDKLGEGKKSIGISFSFLNREETLQDEIIDAAMEKLSDAYKSALGAEIRRGS